MQRDGCDFASSGRLRRADISPLSCSVPLGALLAAAVIVLALACPAACFSDDEQERTGFEVASEWARTAHGLPAADLVLDDAGGAWGRGEPSTGASRATQDNSAQEVAGHRDGIWQFAWKLVSNVAASAFAKSPPAEGVGLGGVGADADSLETDAGSFSHDPDDGAMEIMDDDDQEANTVEDTGTPTPSTLRERATFDDAPLVRATTWDETAQGGVEREWYEDEDDSNDIKDDSASHSPPIDLPPPHTRQDESRARAKSLTDRSDSWRKTPSFGASADAQGRVSGHAGHGASSETVAADALDSAAPAATVKASAISGRRAPQFDAAPGKRSAPDPTTPPPSAPAPESRARSEHNGAATTSSQRDQRRAATARRGRPFRRGRPRHPAIGASVFPAGAGSAKHTGEGGQLEPDDSLSELHPAIVVLVHNRAEALDRLLGSVSRAAGANMSRVTVYQDGSERAVEVVVRSWDPVVLVRLPEFQGEPETPILSSRLTWNYRFMLEHSFRQGHDYVLVLEDDLEIAPDALRFFSWAAKVMAEDKSIFCASGYNDNGFEAGTRDSSRVWRGEHFMALGWMVSRDSFVEVATIFDMDQVWDVPFALTMAGRATAAAEARECIFPEIPRTKHVGDRSRGWLTTSASAQQSWFDLMALHDSAEGLRFADVAAASVDSSHDVMLDLISSAKILHCLWEALIDPPAGAAGEAGGVMVYVFEAGAKHAGQDERWDTVAEMFGLMGRGNGWDRLPRGYYRGVVRTRVGKTLVLLMSSLSPYLPQVPGLTPKDVHAEPRGRDDLTHGACNPPEHLAVEALQSWVLAPSGQVPWGAQESRRRSCADVCAAEGKDCSVEDMWWSVAVPDCAVIDGMLRALGDDLACANGCEIDAAGVSILEPVVCFLCLIVWLK